MESPRTSKTVRNSIGNRPTVAALDKLLLKEFPVLDHGFVRIVDYMGGDEAVVQRLIPLTQVRLYVVGWAASLRARFSWIFSVDDVPVCSWYMVGGEA